ncbi:MAG TPA: hypothetical protein VF188_06120 [Longimicrobiales bacterium]
MSVPMHKRWAGFLLIGLAILTGACAQRRTAMSGSGDPPELAPALVVERFLRAANANDLETMARLFGTTEGSVLERDPRADVERRMFALASILRHDDYALRGTGIVPGRLDQAVQVVVELKIDQREIPVPFTVVRTEDEGWLVEKIEIERITSGG